MTKLMIKKQRILTLMGIFLACNVFAGIPFELQILDSSGPDGPWGKAVGDINNDGRIDLVVQGHEGGGILWYENPTWKKHFIDDSGDGYESGVYCGDIDRDGDADVVVSQHGDIRWYENPGNGIGIWKSRLISKTGVDFLEMEDLDHDGDLDIVARGQSEWSGTGNTLHLIEQISPYSWTKYTRTDLLHGEGAVMMDVNRNGYIDIVVNQNWYENTGTIGPDWPAHTYTTSYTHGNVNPCAGDINGDGRLDIVLAPSERAYNRYRISWFACPTDPKGIWQEHILEEDVQAIHESSVCADFDLDGDIDIAVAEMSQGDDPDEVKLFINSGKGESWTQQVIDTKGAHHLISEDFNNDNYPDLFSAMWRANGQDEFVKIWFNKSPKKDLTSWKRHVIDEDKLAQSVFILAADFDRDGNMDITTGGYWYRNSGCLGASWDRIEIGSPIKNVVAAYDFDEDGDMDILGTQGEGSTPNPNFNWARNDGNASFTIFDNIEKGIGDFMQGVAVGHFALGRPVEVALSWHGGTGNGVQMLTVPHDPSSGLWTHRYISDDDQEECLSTGDIDRDGDIDFLLGTTWLMSNGCLYEEKVLYTETQHPDRSRLADINNDGKLDAVVGYRDVNADRKLAWYEQGATATDPWTEHLIDTLIGPMSVDVGDIDCDGDLDVVVGEHKWDLASSRALVYENLGDGSSWKQHLIHAGDEHHDGMRLCDLDSDGDLDIMSIGWFHNRVIVYENTGSLID